MCARGAVFAGTGLDIGTRFLLEFLPQMPAARHAIDLGCGTGILAAMYARGNPGSRVTATDQSAAAVASARATAGPTASRTRSRRSRTTPWARCRTASADLILLEPAVPRRRQRSCRGRHQADRGGRPGPAPGGELWTVFNSHLHYLPALERLVGPTREVGRNPKFTVTASTRKILPDV